MNQVKMGQVGMATPTVADHVTLNTASGLRITASWHPNPIESEKVDLVSAELQLKAEEVLLKSFKKRMDTLRVPGTLHGRIDSEEGLVEKLVNGVVESHFAPLVYDVFDAFSQFMSQCGVVGRVLYSKGQVEVWIFERRMFTFEIVGASLMYSPHVSIPLDPTIDLKPLLSEGLRRGILEEIILLLNLRGIKVGKDDVEPWKIVQNGHLVGYIVMRMF
jgi:hypothetical protein